jgi:hypothetical protein
VPFIYSRNLEADLKEVDESRERFLRSNRGGDDLATRIVFVVIVLAIAAWIAALYINGHRATDPRGATPQAQRAASHRQ